MTVKIDGQQEPVGIKCVYISFCYDMKLETSGLKQYAVICNNKCIYLSNWSRILARIMDNQVPFEAHLRDSTCQGKEVVYVLLITSILGRLPVVLAGNTGTNPFCYHSSCRNCAHRYNHDLFSTDSRRWGWRLLPNVLRLFLGAGLGPRPLKCMKCCVWLLLHIIGHYYIWYCNIIFTIIRYYYVLYFIMNTSM